MPDPEAPSPPHAARNRRIRIAVRILVIAAIAAALWWFVHEMDFAALGRAFETATIWPLVLAAALNFVMLWGKAACWHVMLAPRHRVATMRLFRYTIAAFATSAIAPARAGEVLRVWKLKRRDNVPIADTAAVAFAEKLLDGISMLLLVAPVPFLLPELPSWVSASMAGCAGIALVLFVVLYIAIGKLGGDDVGSRSWLRRVIAGMHALRSPRRLLAALGVLMIVWLADLIAVLAVLHAVGVHIPIAGGLLVLFTLNLTIAVPSTPAQVGALEVGALAGLELLHVPHEQALAFALLYHALQVIPLIIVGLIFELDLVLGRDPDVKPDQGPTVQAAGTTTGEPDAAAAGTKAISE